MSNVLFEVRSAKYGEKSHGALCSENVCKRKISGLTVSICILTQLSQLQLFFYNHFPLMLNFSDIPDIVHWAMYPPSPRRLHGH